MVNRFGQNTELGYIHEPHEFKVEGIDGILKYSYYNAYLLSSKLLVPQLL